MNLNKHKKALFITDMESGFEPFLHQESTIHSENMLILQSFGPVISHPYGDLMRSIILAVYQEQIEEIFIVGTKDKRNVLDDIKGQLDSNSQQMKDTLKNVDYLFQNCAPEFFGGSVYEWLKGRENGVECVKKSVEIIRHHPLIPSYVKVHGFIVNHNREFLSVG